MASQTATLLWRDGNLPVSVQFDDPYFSMADGLQESRHVFLAGNRMPERFQDGFHIAELGFGTGLNMLMAWQAWQQAGVQGVLHFTSFEAFEMDTASMARALSSFPSLAEHADALLNVWDAGQRTFSLPGINVEIVFGDAREMLPDWSGRADAWFLDGFSPAKNPEIWGADLMHEVATHTKPRGTFATYTAAGFVRNALSDAGFAVSRVAGHGRKRHMTIGELAPQK